MMTRAMTLSVSFLMSLALAPAAFAQGPWPVLSRPTFTTPFQEFTPNRTHYYQPSTIAPAQTNWAPAYDDSRSVPYPSRCAQGQCNSSTGCGPNGQCRVGCCPSGNCANGQCAVPNGNRQAPAMRTRVNSGIAPWGNAPTNACANGQCRRNAPGASSNYGTLRPSLAPSYNDTWQAPFGNAPVAPQMQRGDVNRLIPLDGGYATPTFRNRSSELETEDRQAFDSDVRLQ